MPRDCFVRSRLRQLPRALVFVENVNVYVAVEQDRNRRGIIVSRGIMQAGSSTDPECEGGNQRNQTTHNY